MNGRDVVESVKDAEKERVAVRESQIAHNISSDEALPKLYAQLKIFNNKHPTPTPNVKAFLDEVKSLADQLSDDPANSKEIADATTRLLADLVNRKVDDKLSAIREYEKNVTTPQGWGRFAKGIAAVILYATAVALAVAIPMGVGIALGVWAGPGSFVFAALNALQELNLVTGAVTALVAGFSAWRLGQTVLDVVGFNVEKPKMTKAEEQARKVISAANNLYPSTGVMGRVKGVFFKQPEASRAADDSLDVSITFTA